MRPPAEKERKSLLRNRFRGILKKISDSERRRRSREIISRVLSQPAFQKAQQVLVYCALPDEVQTRQLILSALKLRKEVYLPSVDRSRRQMKIFRIRNWKRDVRTGAYGILEPRRFQSRLGNPRQLEWIAVPGLAFSRKGNRLGRGEGYFDRFLKKASAAQKVGLAFREQIASGIPMEKHDVPVDEVVTG